MVSIKGLAALNRFRAEIICRVMMKSGLLCHQDDDVVLVKVGKTRIRRRMNKLNENPFLFN